MINPGLSLLNYKLHTQPKCQDWTFRTNSWIRYQLHSNHQFSLGFAMGNFQPDISYVNTADQTIDFCVFSVVIRILPTQLFRSTFLLMTQRLIL